MIGAATPWHITIKTDDAAGWGPVNVCVKCTDIGANTISLASWSISQQKDCSTHIILSGLAASYPGTAMPVKKIYYDADLTTTTTSDALENYFTFSDVTASPAGCGAVTCTVYDAGCLSAYTGGHITIDASNNLVLDHNVGLGWGLTTALVAQTAVSICVKCSSPFFLTGVQIDNWQIQQQPDCSSALSQKALTGLLHLNSPLT